MEEKRECPHKTKEAAQANEPIDHVFLFPKGGRAENRGESMPETQEEPCDKNRDHRVKKDGVIGRISS